MSERTSTLPDPYRVRSGDTLSRISHRCGKTVAELQRWNDIRNPNQLEIGQSLYLSEASSLGVTALFLDALRHPIANLPFMLKFDGQSVTGRTGPEGLVPRQVTRTAQSDVEVLVQDLAGAWQQVARAASGYGHKLMTLVSDAVVVPGNTRELPKGVPPKPTPSAKEPTPAGKQPPLPKRTTGAPSKNNPAVKTKATKGPKGEPVLKIEIDIPEDLLKYFSNYTGSAITEKDWEEAAARIECDSAVLKAFAEVESGGRSSFWRLNRGNGAHIPAVLFERHYFSNLTGRRFDKSHPDLSWRVGYRKKELLNHADKKMSDGKVDADDIYGDYASAYLRLIQAFRLDAEAALKSCSWGKFQIMGDNYKLCSSLNVNNFITSMCTSEIAQIKLVCEFIRNKPAAWKNPGKRKLGKEITLWEAVKSKTWQAIAFNYNGPSYKDYNYDAKLKAAYERHKAKTS